MQKKWKILTGAACIIMVLCCMFASACAINTNQNKAFVVKDLTGKEFRFDTHLSKVISTHNPTLNYLVILGNGTSKYIAGFGKKNYADALYSKVLDDWANIESIGIEGAPINKESVIKLNAQLAIVSENYAAQKTDDYAGTGIDTFVCLPNKESLDEVPASMRMLAQLFGEEERARQISEEFTKIKDDVSMSTKNCNNWPNVLFMGQNKYSVTSSNMIQSEIVDLAGGTDIAASHYDHGLFNQVDAESIVIMNPEVIFIPSYAKYNVEDITSDPKLQSVEAVKNMQVYRFPGKLEPWDTPTCTSCLGAAWAANILHPELYTRQKLHEQTVSLYKLLYNKNFAEQDLLY